MNWKEENCMVFITDKSPNQKEFRKHIRNLYLTNESVEKLVDELVESTIAPKEISDRFSGQQLRFLLVDYWLYGWIVVGLNTPKIYNIDNIRVVGRGDRILWIEPHTKKEKDITSESLLIARKTSSYDIIGRSIFEFLVDSQTSFNLAYQDAVEIHDIESTKG